MYMIDRFSVLNFDESAGGAANILQVEQIVAELDLCVVSADTLIQDEDLVGAVASDFSSILLHWEERSLRAIRLMDYEFELLLLVLLLLIHHLVLLLYPQLLLGHHRHSQIRNLLVGRGFVDGFDFVQSERRCDGFGFLGDLSHVCEVAGCLSIFDEGRIFVEAAGHPWISYAVQVSIFLMMMPDWIFSSSLRSCSVRKVMQLPSIESSPEWGEGYWIWRRGWWVRRIWARFRCRWRSSGRGVWVTTGTVSSSPSSQFKINY